VVELVLPFFAAEAERKTMTVGLRNECRWTVITRALTIGCLILGNSEFAVWAARSEKGESTLNTSPFEKCGLYLLVLVMYVGVSREIIARTGRNDSVRGKVGRLTNWFTMSCLGLVVGGALMTALLAGGPDAPLSVIIVLIIFFGIPLVIFVPKLLRSTVTFTLKCVHCGKSIPWSDRWVCGFCGQINGGNKQAHWLAELMRKPLPDLFEGMLFDSCSAKHCKQYVRAVGCPSCQALMSLDSEAPAEAHAAYFEGKRPVPVPAKPVIEEEPPEKTQRKEWQWAEEKMQWQIRLDRLAKEKAEARAERRMYEGRKEKPKSEKQRAAGEIKMRREEKLAYEEAYADEVANAKLIADPELRERTLEVLERIKKERSDF
jgi:hypothetical protein